MPTGAKNRGNRVAAVVLLLNALWLGRGALVTPGLRILLTALAAFSFLLAAVVWNVHRWQPVGDPAEDERRAVRRLAVAELVFVPAVLLVLAVVLVMAMLYYAGQMW